MLTLSSQKKLTSTSNDTKPWGMLRNRPVKRLQSFVQQFQLFTDLQTDLQVTQTQLL